MQPAGATRRTWLPITAAVVALVLWDTPAVWPLKIFVVFLHELSHGLAAVATGGSIVRIELSMAEGGLCVTRGGSRFLTLSAGYLGSLVLGALLLVAGARSRHDRVLVAALGLVTLLVTAAFVRSLFGFGYGVAAGAVLLLIAWKATAGICDALLAVVGSVSCLYAVWDIASDVLLRDIPGSDANALGVLTGVPGAAWGVLWVLVALTVTALALRAAAGGPTRRPRA